MRMYEVIDALIKARDKNARWLLFRWNRQRKTFDVVGYDHSPSRQRGIYSVPAYLLREIITEVKNVFYGVFNSR